MDRIAFVISLGFGVLALTAQQAFSQEQTNCAPRDAALRQLADRWGETRRSVMLGQDDRLFEVFAADGSGIWTILRTTPDGLSSVVASGVAYERMAVAAGSPA